MKNITSIYVILLVFTLNLSFAQIKATRNATKLETNVDFKAETKTNVTDKSCFCCDEFYSLPKPVITGNRQVNCGTQVVFTSTACQGANTIWTVSPTIPGTTQTATSFTVPATAPAGTYTINFQVSCNRERFVSSQLQFTIVSVPNCKPDFLVTVVQLPNGMLNISTNPLMQTPGQEHWWGIQYNGTYPNCNPQAPIPFTSMNASGCFGGYINSSGVLSPFMGSGITIVNGYGITYSGFPNNSCFKITHYVKCCGQLVRQTAYFSVGTSNAKLSNTGNQNPIEIKPQISYSATEIVN